MSISDEIKNRVASGDLYPVVPVYGGPPRRFMFLSRELKSEIDNPAEGHEDRFAELKADLTGFLVNSAIHMDYLKQLKPARNAVWEIRCYYDEPSIRVFGQFAMKNVFIAMTARYRADLGPLQDPNWEYEIRRVRHMWRLLFPSYSAKTSANPENLFDGAIDEKYFDN